MKDTKRNPYCFDSTTCSRYRLAFLECNAPSHPSTSPRHAEFLIDYLDDLRNGTATPEIHTAFLIAFSVAIQDGALFRLRLAGVDPAEYDRDGEDMFADAVVRVWQMLGKPINLPAGHDVDVLESLHRRIYCIAANEARNTFVREQTYRRHIIEDQPVFLKDDDSEELIGSSLVSEAEDLHGEDSKRRIDLMDSIHCCCVDEFDRQIVALRVDGHSDAAVAKRLGLSRSTINRRRHEIERRYYRLREHFDL